MTTIARDMPTQRRPRGPFYAVDSVWKSDIRALMERQQISQSELARRIGAVPGSLILIFKPQTIQSRLVPAIHKALGLEPPTSTTISERDDAKRRLDRVWRDLSPEERELILQLAQRLHRPPH